MSPAARPPLTPFFSFFMNYTLHQLKDRVNTLIEQQGETAYCAAWIYTKEDCQLKDEDGEIDYDNVVEDPEVLDRIFDDVGNIDYIYQVIQECVDEVTEEQYMMIQQEMVYWTGNVRLALVNLTRASLNCRNVSSNF